MIKLKEKLNMEIAYVPVASIKQVREMMFNWTQLNSKIKKHTIISAIIAILPVIYFSYETDKKNMLISVLGILIMLFGAFTVKLNEKYFYYFPFLGFAVVTYAIGNIEELVTKLVLLVIILIPSVFSFAYCYKAFYNYKDVLMLLKKRKGYPNFIFSTADKFADKIYLKNKNQMVAKTRVEASYNPFNSGENINDEEVMRMNTLEYKELKVKGFDIEKGEYYEAKEVKHKEVTYKHGLSIGGYEIIIPHNEIKGESKEEKRRLMRLWNARIEKTLQFDLLAITLMALSIVTAAWSGYGNLFGVLIAIVAFFFGSSCMRLNELPGAYMQLIAPIVWFASSGTNIISVIILVLICIFVAPRTVLWILNYPIIKKLKKEPGYPSFLETNYEKYGDELYIVEKTDHLPKMKANEPIIMDIGYDDEKKATTLKSYGDKTIENTSWNAFDYLEKDPDNSIYDEFAYMEQIQKAKMNAPLRNDIEKADLKKGAVTIGDINENKNNQK